jgi:hypothetical protein
MDGAGVNHELGACAADLAHRQPFSPVVAMPWTMRFWKIA